MKKHILLSLSVVFALNSATPAFAREGGGGYAGTPNRQISEEVQALINDIQAGKVNDSQMQAILTKDFSPAQRKQLVYVLRTKLKARHDEVAAAIQAAKAAQAKQQQLQQAQQQAQNNQRQAQNNQQQALSAKQQAQANQEQAQVRLGQVILTRQTAWAFVGVSAVTNVVLAIAIANEAGVRNAFQAGAYTASMVEEFKVLASQLQALEKITPQAILQEASQVRGTTYVMAGALAVLLAATTYLILTPSIDGAKQNVANAGQAVNAAGQAVTAAGQAVTDANSAVAAANQAVDGVRDGVAVTMAQAESLKQSLERLIVSMDAITRANDADGIHPRNEGDNSRRQQGDNSRRHRPHRNQQQRDNGAAVQSHNSNY